MRQGSGDIRGGLTPTLPSSDDHSPPHAPRQLRIEPRRNPFERHHCRVTSLSQLEFIRAERQDFPRFTHLLVPDRQSESLDRVDKSPESRCILVWFKADPNLQRVPSDHPRIVLDMGRSILLPCVLSTSVAAEIK